jgi:predicted exporter
VSPRTKIIIWIGLLFIVALIIIFRIRVETDISFFLPRSSSPQEQFLINQFRQGPGSKLLIISLQGGDSKTLAQTSNSLTQKLKNDRAFVKVINSEDAITPQMEKFLFSNRYLLSPTLHPDRFSPESLHKILSDTLDRMTLLQGYIEKRYFGRDPTGEFLATLRSWTGKPMLNKNHGVWFSQDGKHAFLVVEIFAEGFDLNHFENAVNRVNDSFNELKPNHSMTLNMVGPPAFAVASRQSIRRDATELSIIATCLVVGVIYLFYRSTLLVLFCSIPLLCGIMFSISMVVLVFGSIHGITLAFGIIIIGVAIDYPIHLFSHLKSDEHPSEAMDRIWPTLRLGVLTTSLGYVSMIFSGFDGLIQLAIFAVCGLVSASLVTRHILPHVTGFLLRTPFPVKISTIPFELLSKNKILFYVLLAGAISTLILQRNELWENDIAQLSPIPSSQLALDRQVRKELNLPNISFWVVVKGKSEELVLQRTESVSEKIQVLKNQGNISGFESVTKYLPSVEKQSQRIKALPSSDQLKENLRIAQQGLPFREKAFEGFFEEISRAKKSEFLTFDRLKGTQLETPIKKLFFNQGNFWFSLISFKGTVDEKLIAGAINSFPSESVFVLEPRKTSNTLINRYRDLAILMFFGGCLIIAITLKIALRQWVSLGRILIPILGSVLTVMAILTAAKVQLSLFHLVSLLLVIGLGLDYALFLNRKLKLKEEQSKTHHALLLCNLSTVSVFGTLAFSATPVLRAIGSTVAIGAFLCLWFSFIFAPKTKVMNKTI